MAKTTAKPIPEGAHDLRCQLAAGAVDVAAGVIRGATVAKAGVPALGHFLLLDKKGARVRDPKLAVRKLQIFTDEKTLTTLMGAIQDAGGNLKVREDHDDSLGARAGFIDGFRLADGGIVTGDIHLFDAYRHRDVVLETTNKTPGKIGLSIDMTPSFEIVGEKAFMRIEAIEAVDIVDAGAITPDGMFLSVGVDRPARLKLESAEPPEHTTMASPTPEEIMAAVAALKGVVDQCVASIAGMTAAAATPGAAMKAEIDALRLKAENAEKEAKAATAATAAMKRDRALLGFKGTPAEKLAMASKTAEEIEAVGATAKGYLDLVAERAETMKCKKSDAHVWVQKNNRPAYAEHLRAKGVYDPAKDEGVKTAA